jgi:hypothetical protein
MLVALTLMFILLATLSLQDAQFDRMQREASLINYSMLLLDLGAFLPF